MILSYGVLPMWGRSGQHAVAVRISATKTPKSHRGTYSFQVAPWASFSVDLKEDMKKQRTKELD